MYSTLTNPLYSASGNLFCDSSLWNIIGGNWKYNSTDCSLHDTGSVCGNIVWFGSADGLTPSSQYIHEEFILTTKFSLQSGESQQVSFSNAGLIFRTGESSSTNNEGPTYYVGLNAEKDQVQFGTMDDGWSLKHYTGSTIDYDTVYTLSVHAAGDIYNVYLDGVLVMEDISRTEFSGGSFGVRTCLVPATFYSLTYERMCSTDPYGLLERCCNLKCWQILRFLQSEKLENAEIFAK